MKQIDYASFYGSLPENIAVLRRYLERPLTLTEKILGVHCASTIQLSQLSRVGRGQDMLTLQPDRVALQDATAQMALLQFMQSRRAQVAVPTTVHCDHLIRAEVGADRDLEAALGVNQEVYDFLRSASSKYSIGFWSPGAGIIHQVVLENHALPGGLMLGTDSHTPNAGGLAMLAIGVGGADAAEVMVGLPWEVLSPKIVGVHLTGSLSGWLSAKDVITHLCTMLTVKGGTNKIIEYFGPGVSSISATGRATICNMGAELGATTSVFPFDERTARYLHSTNRPEVADLIEPGLLSADPEVLADPHVFFDEVVEINLDELKPWIVGPHSPDRGRPLSELKIEIQSEGWPTTISTALIGSCTNSSFEDMTRAASVVQQGLAAGLQLQVPLLVTPGSAQIYALMKEAGLIDIFESAGATVLANACGPCIGMWRRSDVPQGTSNAIVSSYNRNFPKRNDDNPATLSFITSPEAVVAMAFSGNLGFDPQSDSIVDPEREPFQFQPPHGFELPAKGFPESSIGFEVPAEDPASIQIVVPVNSERLQLLEPFPAWDGKDILDLPILMKTRGKTTTDHISPAGPWLRKRGHLDLISDNMLLGATNGFTGAVGQTIHPLTGEDGHTPAEVARDLKAKGIRWVIVGDENYGEGSSREHAAMSPRYLGCAAVIARSFARIHETNLKKQGVLPLTFADPDDYERVQTGDQVSVVELQDLEPGVMVEILLRHSDGEVESVWANHSMTAEQIGWFRAGSALNLIH